MTPKSNNSPLYDKAAIIDAVRLIVGDGNVTELRVLGAVTKADRRGHTLAGYFDDAVKLADALAGAGIDSAKGVYFIPNVVQSALLARAVNRVRKAESGDSTQDSHIVRRRWLLIDADAKRPSGISASDGEHAAALAKAEAMRVYLSALGWPEPIAADSGNGGHLLYAIDLAADDDGLVQRCLLALAQRFDDDAVQIDKMVYNPARIWKLYGTRACKGDSTPERPHRMSRILTRPSELTPVPLDLLHALAAEAVDQKAVAGQAGNGPALHNANGATFDVAAFLQRHHLDVSGPEDWNGKQGPGQRWVFRTSPLCEHHDGAAYIVQHASGAITAACHHNSCKGKWGWADLRRKYEPIDRGSNSKPSDGERRRRSKPELVRVSDVTPEQVRWLWPGRIPLGKLTELIGDPDLGKSFVTLDMAARVTVGGRWPDSPSAAAKGSVILLSAEDGVADTIRPRLDALGADTALVTVLPAILYVDESGERRQHVDLSRHLPHLEDAIRQTPDCRLVIIDPISAYLGENSLTWPRDTVWR